MEEYCIITPTFSGHFKYINNYLKSFCKYVIDAKRVPIYFILSDFSERTGFEKIVKPYQDKADLHILYFSELLKHYGIKEISDLLLHKYGRYSYQTLKKMYAMLAIDAKYFLILDSESMWVRKTSMKKMFDKFIKDPFILGSSLKIREQEGTATTFMVETLSAVENVLKGKCEYIFQEHFTWFYKKEIIYDLCKDYGSPIALIETVYSCEIQKKQKIFGLMELSLLHEFVYRNREKYGYKFINVENALQEIMGEQLYQLFRRDFVKNFFGQLGVVEFPFAQLSASNVRSFGRFFNINGITILRCTKSNQITYSLQKRFFKYANPYILAASQNHWFGINKRSLFDRMLQ